MHPESQKFFLTFHRMTRTKDLEKKDQIQLTLIQIPNLRKKIDEVAEKSPQQQLKVTLQ